MRVTVHPAGEDACALYRMDEPARVLADQGADVHLTRDLTFRVARDRGGNPICLTREPDTDVVVLQRPLHRAKLDLVDLLQRAGVAVVVELDDDFGAVPPSNVAHLDAHREWMTTRQWSETVGGPLPVERATGPDGRRWARAPGVLAPSSDLWLRRACKAADLVTCTTPALAERYAPHGRVAVLPNLVPERYLSIEAPPHDGTVVGWGGSVATHVGDLESTGGGVARAVAESGARFHVIGTGVRVAKALGLADEPTATGWVELEAWPAALAALDVGIVPLASGRFSDAKSWLKGLEYASVGVPFVASPTPDYVRLNAQGAGVLASHPAEWERGVRALVESEDLRADLAGLGREAASRLTYEQHGERWLDAWASALEHRRSDRLAA